MPHPPEVHRIDTLWRRERWFRRAGLTGLGAIAVGVGLGFAGLGMRFATAACIAGAAFAVVALMIGSVFTAKIALANRKFPLDDLDDAPLEAGEMVGEMKVVVADGETLHLSMGASPVLVGLHRLLGCLALLGLAAAVAVLILTGQVFGPKAWILVAGGVMTAVTFARVPFAMQWIAGDVRNGQKGLAMERVRWFFLRDTYVIAPADIGAINETQSGVVLYTRTGETVALASVPPTAISGWTKRRLISDLSRTLRYKELKVEEPGVRVARAA